MVSPNDETQRRASFQIAFLLPSATTADKEGSFYVTYRVGGERCQERPAEATTAFGVATLASYEERTQESKDNYVDPQMEKYRLTSLPK